MALKGMTDLSNHGVNGIEVPSNKPHVEVVGRIGRVRLDADGLLANPQGRREWIGIPPKHCRVCSDRLAKLFYDCKTKINGKFMVLCKGCYGRYGYRCGGGSGQKYRRANDGTFYRVLG